MKYTLLLFIAMTFQVSIAQNINWNSNKSNQQSIYLNFGYDFGMTTQIGFAHQIKARKPILLSADYSTPKGKDLIDDFKIRIGGQVSLFEKGNIGLSAKAYGIFRRHETKLVRMANFGTELGAILGYYKSTWHIAGELGIDKSIITHLKHSKTLEEAYPSITDGWFIPSGGHFYYGVQIGKTLSNQFEISLRIGSTDAQFDDENALLPKYAQVGIVYNLKTKDTN